MSVLANGLPQPLLSLLLMLLWLLLNNSAAPGHLVLGALLGLLIQAPEAPARQPKRLWRANGHRQAGLGGIGNHAWEPPSGCSWEPLRSWPPLRFRYRNPD